MAGRVSSRWNWLTGSGNDVEFIPYALAVTVFPSVFSKKHVGVPLFCHAFFTEWFVRPIVMQKPPKLVKLPVVNDIEYLE